jgi:SAM-dependent methyltransferase
MVIYLFAKYMMRMMYILIIIGIIILVILKTYYNHIIHTYFRNKNNIMYDYLIQYIQVVDDTNYFMNYGLWDNNNTTLKDANKNLCKFIYNKANLGGDGFIILDVGCGYGHQDFYWIKKMNPLSKIYAVDISDTQIKYANDMRVNKQIPESKLQFIQGDAHNIDGLGLGQMGSELEQKFDRIISLESAFHYKDRPLFFNQVGKLLDKNNGRFIISDIILSGSGNGSMLLNLFCDFLHIPKQNLICLPEWKSQLETAGLTIMDIYDVTEQTFCPYYKYFFNEYIKNKGLPEIMSRMLYSIFTRNQPFSYIIAVCSVNGL